MWIIIVILIVAVFVGLLCIIGKKKKADEIAREEEEKLREMEKPYGSTDPIKRSKEWFLSAEGEASFKYYLAIFNNPYVHEKILTALKTGDSSDVMDAAGYNVIKYRKTAPFSFLIYYIDAIKPGLGVYIMSKSSVWTEVYVYTVITSYFAKNYNEENYLDLISFEKNPFLKFLAKFKFFEPTSKNKGEQVMIEQELRNIYDKFYYFMTSYIKTALDNGEDASEESWIYDKANYIREDGELYTIEDIAYAITVNAKHKDCVKDFIKQCGMKSFSKSEIDNRAMLAGNL